jgi:hypothetical protein
MALFRKISVAIVVIQNSKCFFSKKNIFHRFFALYMIAHANGIDIFAGR